MEGALLRQKPSGGASGGGSGGGSHASGGGGAEQRWRGLWTSAESLVGLPIADGGGAGRAASRPESTQGSKGGHSRGGGGGGGGKENSQRGLGGNGSASGREGPLGCSFLFKVSDGRGKQVHRIHAASDDLAALEALVRKKLAPPAPEQGRCALAPNVNLALTLRLSPQPALCGAAAPCYSGTTTTRATACC